MMVFTTAFAAVIIVGLLYVCFIRFLPWRNVSYAVVAIAGFLCILDGTVHFTYIGLEVIALGWCVVRFHFNRKSPNNKSLD